MQLNGLVGLQHFIRVIQCVDMEYFSLEQCIGGRPTPRNSEIEQIFYLVTILNKITASGLIRCKFDAIFLLIHVPII